MIEIAYKPSFLKQLNELDEKTIDIILKKNEILRDQRNHIGLKVHKLHGKLSNCYSFSINYSLRIIFQYENKKMIVLLDLGKHDIYR